MSRSLDTSLLAQMKKEDPRPAYESLSTLLSNLPESGLLEIEFLGYSHPLESGLHFLQDGNAVAIPKLRLIQAFSVARQILQAHLCSKTLKVPHSVVSACAILLLMDPEHLTAANTRKRSLLDNDNLTEVTLRREKLFLDTLLTARLHRHTKSPTLWSHRRWLFLKSRELGIAWNVKQDVKDVIMTAAQRHPRNYVAWQHARILLGSNPDLAEDLVDDVKEFCLRNHSDISAWSFLSSCVTRIEDDERRQKTCSTLLAEILSLTESFRWTNESVWTFLRTIFATKTVSEEQMKRFIAAIDKLYPGTTGDAFQQKTLDNAREWCNKYHVS
ncbi:hypothetical protein F5Y16DRAFT_400914 [Xylariaceae sp. FL0255]|nr:hypothetical protein F5Y16DRAFT_400914 [Xylariaceae sp. FL0255]